MIRKRREYAAIAQSVERILGKDEVASSNLASSSRKVPKSLWFRNFFLFSGLYLLIQFSMDCVLRTVFCGTDVVLPNHSPIRFGTI